MELSAHDCSQLTCQIGSRLCPNYECWQCLCGRCCGALAVLRHGQTGHKPLSEQRYFYLSLPLSLPYLFHIGINTRCLMVWCQMVMCYRVIVLTQWIVQVHCCLVARLQLHQLVIPKFKSNGVFNKLHNHLIIFTK
jgi:hypothetical protein